MTHSWQLMPCQNHRVVMRCFHYLPTPKERVNKFHLENDVEKVMVSNTNLLELFFRFHQFGAGSGNPGPLFGACDSPWESLRDISRGCGEGKTERANLHFGCGCTRSVAGDAMLECYHT